MPLHVKAHAGKKKPLKDMTRPEQVNIYFDRAASTELREQMTATHKRPEFEALPNMNMYLQHNGKFVTSHEQSILLWTRAEEDIQDYYAKKYNWTRTTQTTLDWQTFGTARKGLPHLDHFITKLCTGWLPTYYHLNKMEGLKDECPLCKQSETTDHLFVCKQRCTSRTIFFMKFQGLLIDLKSSPRYKNPWWTESNGLSHTTWMPTSNQFHPLARRLTTKQK